MNAAKHLIGKVVRVTWAFNAKDWIIGELIEVNNNLITIKTMRGGMMSGTAQEVEEYRE